MKRKMLVRCLIAPSFVAVCIVAASSIAVAEVKLASVFGDHMVLQQELAVPVWGWAAPGERVKVTFGEQTKEAEADKDGRWQVNLDALKASADGKTLSVAGSNTIDLKDVLVGEVWICSGQSNMEWSLNNSLNAKEEVAAANHPQIRLFDVPGHTVSPLPNDTCPGTWKICQPDSTAGFSAVGYFFGRRLQQELNVPIGLVGSNWGGTRIEPWTSPDGFHSVPELKAIADQVDAYTADTKVEGGSPSAIYNAMVHPLAPFAMRGAIWYQGESNGGEGESYYHKTQALVNGWRKLFNPELAFYWVQLADFQQPNENPAGGDGWAKLREAQRKALNIKHTGMAVIIDIGEANDIHPRNKQDVGARLAQWALHQTYGKTDLVPSGPMYKSHKVDGNTIRVSFDATGGGLIVGKKAGLEPTQQVKDGKLQRFAIAGADKQWHWADATIDGDTVVVKSAEVAEPVAVRYAFSMNPAGANLYNKEGLPASPFRTDDW
ncbi:MAG: sialate O-acetylesterase [Planctomycetota bacterium]